MIHPGDAGCVSWVEECRLDLITETKDTKAGESVVSLCTEPSILENRHGIVKILRVQ